LEGATENSPRKGKKGELTYGPDLRGPHFQKERGTNSPVNVLQGADRKTFLRTDDYDTARDLQHEGGNKAKLGD